MRIGYVGSVEFSWHCLKAILEGGGNVVGVFSLDSKRSRRVSDFRSLSDLALSYDVPHFEFDSINSSATLQQLRSLNPDIVFVMGLSQLLSAELLDMPPLGCIGSHPALLPRGRGRALIPWAILGAWEKTGLTLFYMDSGVDSGDILAQREIMLASNETATTLYEKITRAGVEMLRENLPLLAQGRAPRVPQEHGLATYCPRRTAEDGFIEWAQSSSAIHKLVRAVTHPYPGAFTWLNGSKLIIWDAIVPGASGSRGLSGQVAAVDERGISVFTGDGLLIATRVQLDSGPEITSGQMPVMSPVAAGIIFGKRSFVVER